MDRKPFLDWMKAIGMLLIVYGHSSAGTRFFATEPIVVKQLGVALFVFATAYTLAAEKRPTAYVLFSRLFTIYLYGFGFAVLMSFVSMWVYGDFAESNYLPFMAGANVLINWFPANPTTWYIGTYLHILLLWAFLRHRIQLRWWMLLAWLPVSIALRAMLMESAGLYVAYMLITNWLAVFLLGFLVGRDGEKMPVTGLVRWRGVGLAAGLGALFFVIWPACLESLSFGKEFPFRQIQLSGSGISALVTSLLVEFIYLLGTLFVFQLALMLPRSRVVEFFARNTLPIFIFHMPLVYLLHKYVAMLDNGYMRVGVNILLYYVMLAFVGEALAAIVRRTNVKAICLARLQRFRAFQLVDG